MQNSPITLKQGNHSFLHLLCYIFIFSLPFTSSPILFFLPNDVKPLALLTSPVLIFFFIVFKKRIPSGLTSNKFLLLFVVYATIVTILHIIGNLDLVYKNSPLSSFAIRAMSTIFIGFIIFLASKIAVHVLGPLLFLKLTLTAYSLSLWYATIQFVFSKIPSLFSVIDFTNQILATSNTEWWYRVHGLASEASLLSSQIYLVILPILILSANFKLSIVNKKTLYLLYALIFLCLVGSGSRWGAVVILVIVVLSSFTDKNLVKRFSRVIIVGSATVVLSSFAIGNSLYFQQSLSEIQLTNVVAFAQSISVHTRLAALLGAFDTFVQNPIFGVGIGMSDYWIGFNLPQWSLGEPEVISWLDPEKITFRPNPKNMFLRLLSELGLIGFFLFAAFVLKEIYLKHFIFFVFAFVIALDFISIDSFAMPTIWVAITLASCSKTLLIKGEYV